MGCLSSLLIQCQRCGVQDMLSHVSQAEKVMFQLPEAPQIYSLRFPYAT